MDWNFISKLVVRRTGFPFEYLESLQCQHTSELMIQIISYYKKQKKIVIDLSQETIPQLVKRYAEDHQDKMKLLSRMRRYLGKGMIRSRECEEAHDLFVEENDFLLKIQAWMDIEHQVKETFEEARKSFAIELERNRRTLQQAFHDPYMAEAVYISNPDVYNLSLSKFIHHTEFERRPSYIRTLEMRFYSYLQRFCSKNDTASYFGPMNYAEWDTTEKEPLVLENENTKFTQRKVFYSFWMVQGLAQQIAEDPEFHPHIVPKLHPLSSLKGSILYFHSQGKSIKLPENYVLILQEIQKKIPLWEIAKNLNLPLNQFEKGIEQLVTKGIIQLEIEIPSTIFDPFSYLVDWVKGVDISDQAKNKWLGILDHFEELKASIYDRDLDHRRAVTSQMEHLFAEVVGKSARRNQGKMYADRTLYYEECKGSIQRMKFGKKFHDTFMEKLTPVLDLSVAYGDVLRDYYQTMAIRLFSQITNDLNSELSYAEFIHCSQKILEQGDFDDSFEPLQAFHELLHHLVQKKTEGSIANLTEKDIKVFDQFRKYDECHTSPDIMFSAPNLSSLKNGDYKIVLGEVHQFIAMWGSQLLFDDQRDAVNEEINQFIDKMPMYRKLAVLLNTRRHKGLIHESFPGKIIQLFGIPSKKAAGVVPFQDLKVTYQEGQLQLKDQDEENYFLYNSGDENIHLWAFAPSRVSSPEIHFQGHTPRVEINGVVFQRERWEIPRSEWEHILVEDNVFNIFFSIMELKEKYSLPRFVFFKVESEKKPYYLDFENFFAVEILHSLLKRNQLVTFIEMEPSPKDLWLKDNNGKYCFEMRGTVFQLGKENLKHVERDVELEVATSVRTT
jgi:hypothetical protein